MYDFISDLPSWLRSAGEVGFSLTTVGAIAVILLALLVTRRWQVALAVVAAGAGAWLVAIALRSAVDSDSVREAAGLDQPEAGRWPPFAGRCTKDNELDPSICDRVLERAQSRSPATGSAPHGSLAFLCRGSISPMYS